MQTNRMSVVKSYDPGREVYYLAKLHGYQNSTNELICFLIKGLMIADLEGVRLAEIPKDMAGNERHILASFLADFEAQLEQKTMDLPKPQPELAEFLTDVWPEQPWGTFDIPDFAWEHWIATFS